MTKTYTYSNIAGLQRALRKLPKEASAELRDASVRIAGRVAKDAQGRAQRVGGVSVMVAPTIRPTRDRVPKILMGSKTAGLPPRNGHARKGDRQTIGDVIWGAEFGAGPRLPQFDDWRGSGEGAGYFLWPAVRGDHDRTMDDYGDALMSAVDHSARGAH